MIREDPLVDGEERVLMGFLRIRSWRLVALALVTFTTLVGTPGVGSAHQGSSQGTTLPGFASVAQVLTSVRAATRETHFPPSITPSFSVLESGAAFGDQSLVHSACRQPIAPRWSSIAHCTFGDTSARTTVALVGDSRARMYLDAMNTLGKLEHFRVVYLALSACPTALGDFATNLGVPVATPWALCNTFHTFTVHAVNRLRPTLTLVMSDNEIWLTKPFHQAAPAEVVTDMEKYYNGFSDKQRTLVFVNYPQPGEVHTPDLCLSKLPSNIQQCSFVPSAKVTANDTAQRTAAQRARVGIVDERAWYCASTCPAIVHGTVVYTPDSYHTTYAYTMYLLGALWARIAPYLR